MTPTLGGAARRAALGALALGAALAAPWGAAPAAPAAAAGLALIKSCPYAITRPGLYVLAGDLTCPGTAIAITADDVRLVLGGNILTGDGGGHGVLASGNSANPTLEGLRIGNGAVRGFDIGVFVDAAPGARVARVTAAGNGRGGIAVTNSPGARVEGNTASRNGLVGIVAGESDGSRLAGNRTADNGDEGLLLFDTGNARVEGNTSTGNGDDGIDLQVSEGNLVRGNTTTGNDSSGIEVSGRARGNRLEGNRATGNAGFDLEDVNLDPPACANTWRGNRFVTDNEGDGPAAGCIR